MSNEYGKQVADLIENAFSHAREAARADGKGDSVKAAGLQHHATLQVAGAQAISTLALATEVRAVGLLLAAASHPAAEASAELARDAFAAAVIMLGLVEAEPERTSADVAADLYGPGKDPADRDVEL